MDWFDNNNFVKNVPLIELANVINNPVKKIQLPTFQRDAVWDEKHVELLWDSILRKFPIGSLLFARTIDYEQNIGSTKGLMISKDDQSKKTNKSSDQTEYIIIDGQQRSISISLGCRDWRLKDSARLWIDLGNRKTDKDDDNFLIRLYVCSNRKPWGLNATSSQIREALRMIKNKSIEDISDIDDFDKRDDDLLNKTWPVRASAPVPFNDFVKAVKNNKYKDWKTLIPDYIPVEFKKRIDDNSVKIEELAVLIKGLESYEIPLYLIKKLETVEDLGSAFQRINKQGVPMSDDDLFFSGLKMVWPESHDLVWEIYDDLETGKFLQPADIVHNVIRLSAANIKPNGRKDIIDLNLKEFKSLIGTRDIEENEFFKRVKFYLKKDNNGRSFYHSYLLKAKKFLQYDPVENPEGLPSLLLAKLNKRVWHTITAWLDHNKNLEPSDKNYEDSRLEIIRYALFDLLYLRGSSSSIMHLPFEIAFAAGIAKEQFSGYWIYREMIDCNFFKPGFKLYEPDKLKLYNADEIPVSNLFINEISLVHWNQREYLHKWFPNFDPILYRTTEDLPYDVDHIIAGHHFNMQGRKNIHDSFWKKISDTGIASSSGNFRLWPKSLNRSDQDNNLWEKYILGEIDKEIKITDENYAAKYLTMKPFGFTTVGEVRVASCIGEDDLDCWEKATNRDKEFDWSDQSRVDAFIKAVQNRKAQLYTNLFESLNWKKWLSEDISRPVYLPKDTQVDILGKNEAIIADISPANIMNEEKDAASLEKIQKIIDKIIPDKISQKYCVDIFADSIIECNNNGSNKWGITVYDKMIFLNYGSIAIAVIINNGIELYMSSIIGDTYNGLIEAEKGYSAIDSTYAYYTPSDSTYEEVWSKLKINHFLLIQNAAVKFKKLREPSMKAHSNKFIDYLENVTGKKLPRPNY